MSEAGACGDFGASHAFDQTEDESFAVGFRKRADSVECSVGLSEGVRTRRRGKRGRVRIRARSFVGEFVVGLSASVKIVGAVAGDGSEPTREFGDFAKGDDTRQSLQENILKEVVHVGVRNAREQDAMDHAGVSGVENAEGGPIASLCGPDDGIVCGVDVGRRGHEAAGEWSA